jgi:hypothetical protein
MELGVYVPVRVWVGRSSGSYDAHSFHPPMLHNQRVSPAVVLLQGCWPVTEPVPEILAGLLPSRRYTETCMLSLGQDIRRWHQPRREFRTRITGGGCRGVRAQKVRRRRGDRAVGILGVGEGSPRRTAPSPRSVAACRSLARSGTRRIRECGPARATATAVSRIEAISKQFATNSRNSLLFGRSAVRLLPRRP